MKTETKTAIAKKVTAGIMAAVMTLTPAYCAFAAAPKVTKSASVTATKTAAKKNLSKATVTVAAAVYTGKALKPKVTVKYGKTTLKSGKDYTVTYSANKNIGVGKVTVKAKSSSYSGSKTVSFNIVPAAPKVSATTNASSVTIKWNKVAGAGRYIVYSYNAKNKKYTKLKELTGTSYTHSKRAAATVYSYSVKAVTVKNKKTYNSALANITVCTAPSKPTSLKATPSTTSVSLSWKKVSGATGYYVYSYNASKKQYTKVATVKTNKATIKNLKAGTAYSYAVAAYKTTGKFTATGAKSTLVKVTTKKAATSSASANLNKYYNIFRSGQYKVKHTMDGGSDLGTLDITTYVKNGNIRMDMPMTMEGISMDCIMIYNKKKNNATMYASVMGINVKYNLSKEEMQDFKLDGDMMTEMFAPKMAAKPSIKEGTKKIGKTTYATASYKTSGGATATYYFSGNVLKKINITNGSETVDVGINGVESTVKDSAFNKPLGIYIDIDSLG